MEKHVFSQAWWRTHVLTALRRLRHKDCCEFVVGLGYAVRPHFKTKTRQRCIWSGVTPFLISESPNSPCPPICLLRASLCEEIHILLFPPYPW